MIAPLTVFTHSFWHTNVENLLKGPGKSEMVKKSLQPDPFFLFIFQVKLFNF